MPDNEKRRLESDTGLTEPELQDLLRQAKRRVIQLERLLSLGLSGCEHKPVKQFPTGMRDNGECWLVCARCGREL